MALTTGLGEGFAIPTAGGRCAFVFDLRPGTSSPAVSLFDVVNPYPLLRLEGAWGYLSLGLP